MIHGLFNQLLQFEWDFLTTGALCNGNGGEWKRLDAVRVIDISRSIHISVIR